MNKALPLLVALALQCYFSTALIKCSGSICTLENYQGPWLDRIPCNVLKVFYPTNEAELVKAVAYAVEHKHKVKVVSRNAHTVTKFACPGSDSDPGVLISTTKYNSTLLADHKRMTATAGSGVQLRNFIDWLAEQGLALEQTTLWDGVSVAGMVSTGAHGTGLRRKGGGIVEYVVSLRLVIPAGAEDGYAKVIELTSQDKELFQAARISLGTLGALSQVTFSVQPLFKRAATVKLVDDEYLESQALGLPGAHDYVDLHWFVTQNKFVARTDDRVASTTPGDGAYVTFLPVQGAVIRQSRELEEMQQASGNASTFYCAGARNLVNTSVASSGLTNDGKVLTEYPVIGYNNKLQAAGGCQYTYENATNLALAEDDRLVCGWDYEAHGTLWFHISVFIPLSKLASFIRDVKELRDKAGVSKLCMIDSYFGLQMRFVKGSSAYLGNREDAAVVEFLAFRDRNPGQPQTYGDIVDEIEQMLVYKYGGKPHFGKNRPHAFTDVGRKVRNLAKFVEVKRKMDPEGWFSSGWSDAVLGVGGSLASYVDGCALDGVCVCREDRHCSPEKGYICQEGIVYKDARVCRKIIYN